MIGRFSRYMIPAASAAAICLGAMTAAQAGDVDTIKFEGVVEFSTNFWYTDFEKPYFEETLPQLSGGKLTANAVPFDQLGMSGFEMMKLLQIGTYDFAAGTIGYVTGDNPALEGMNLAGSMRDVDDFRKIEDGYFDTFAAAFEQTFNSKLLAFYTYPVSLIFCNMPDKGDTISLADLNGTTIRSYAATVSDFIEGVGATAVVLPFGEVPTAMQRGTIDCVVSTTMTAYNTKFHQVSTHLLQVPVNYAVGYFAFNLDTWNSLTPESQELVETSMKELADQMVERTVEDENDALACLGAGPCKYGEPGNLQLVPASDADMEKMKEIVQSHILPRWASRCGSANCVGDWNAFVGPVLGIDYKP